MALRAAAVVAAVLALAGCGDDDLTTADRPSPHPRPSTAGYCDDLPGVSGDPGVLLGTDWSGEDHDVGDPVVVLACAATNEQGTLSLEADGTGITITPDRVPLEDLRDGMAEFRVTVERGAHGTLAVREESRAISGTMPGPRVVTDDEGWHLERPAG
ncbi:hypothetical protein [Nocardioides marmoribigeumensis]|uniref:DUF3515 family protein n=1 Tax=Nocardioides marmoribigeumensis TaxID=433649 RepID=A0ABU2BZY1_9ACTN|nr:hypothetical protein [Nocardioides marmoribigeumensis]MDR7363967.1 hypothetical protein [Nocardioides marmoribigeumensis]